MVLLTTSSNKTWRYTVNKAQYILHLMEQATYVYEDDYKDNTTFMKRHGGALSAAALGVAGGAAAYYGMKHGVHLGGTGSNITQQAPPSVSFPKPGESGIKVPIPAHPPVVHPGHVAPSPSVPSSTGTPAPTSAPNVQHSRSGLAGGRAGGYDRAQHAMKQMAQASGETTTFSPSGATPPVSGPTSAGQAKPLASEIDRAMGRPGVQRPKGPLQGQLPGGVRQEIPRGATLQGSKEVDAEFKASLGAGAPFKRDPFAKYNIR